MKLARRVSDDAEKVGPLLSRSIKAEAGVDFPDLGRRARRLLEATAGPSEQPEQLFDAGVKLDRQFFARSVHEVAPELIGATLLVDGVGGPIVEAEAYDREDPRATATAASRSGTAPCSARQAPPTSTAPTGSTGA